MWKFVIVVIALMLLAAPTLSQDANLLQNPGMNGRDYVGVSSDPTAAGVSFNVPGGWAAYFLPPGPEPWMNAHPTGFPHDSWIKREGDASYHIARGGATFTAIVYQIVRVEPNTPVSAGAWAWIESRKGRIKVGISPTGNTDHNAGDVVWTDWVNERDEWVKGEISTTSQSDAVTLFLYAEQTEPSNPNGVYWDDAWLFGTPASGPLSDLPTGPAPIPRFVTPTNRVNVRAEAVESAAWLGVIEPGQQFTLLQELPGWNQIDYNGRPGFVTAAFTQIIEGSAPAAADTAAATAGGDPAAAPAAAAAPTGFTYTPTANVRLRSAPTTESGTLGTVPYEGVAQVEGRSADNIWLKVSYDGVVGWVAAEFGTTSGALSALPVVE